MLQPIPAIDIINGQCVRLTQGDYSSTKIYDESPVRIACQFEKAGFRRLHLVDLDGAKSAHVVNLNVLKEIKESTHLEVDFGGGIKSDRDLDAVFDNGATYATIGSVAVSQPALFREWVIRYGPERIILGADVRNGHISINGWKEDSKISIDDFLHTYLKMGIRNVLCTDISKDGLLLGTSVDLYKHIMECFPECNLIASGGVSSMHDLEELDEAGIPAVVFGKAIYEHKIDLSEVIKRFYQS